MLKGQLEQFRLEQADVRCVTGTRQSIRITGTQVQSTVLVQATIEEYTPLWQAISKFGREVSWLFFERGMILANVWYVWRLLVAVTGPRRATVRCGAVCDCHLVCTIYFSCVKVNALGHRDWQHGTTRTCLCTPPFLCTPPTQW